MSLVMLVPLLPLLTAAVVLLGDPERQPAPARLGVLPPRSSEPWRRSSWSPGTAR